MCHSLSTRPNTLSPRPLPPFPPFLALRVDANIGTDLHPSSWDCSTTSCTIAHGFSVLVPIPLLENNLVCFRKALSSGVLWGSDSQAVLSASHTDLVEPFTSGQIIQGVKMEESHPLKLDVISPLQFPTALHFFFPSIRHSF